MTAASASSSPPTNGRWRRFDQALHRHLDADNYRFCTLPTRFGRVQPVLDLVLRHADSRPRLVLNVGSASFVLEFLVEPRRPWQFLSIDLDPGYMPLYRELCLQRLLTRTTFLVIDVRRAEFRDASFDGVVVHDVLYTPSLQLDELLPRFRRWLKPEGFLCFDVWDRSATRLWQLAGRDYGRRRYDIAEIRARLGAEGLELVEQRPYFGSSPAVRMLRCALWIGCGVTNARQLFARKTGRASPAPARRPTASAASGEGVT